MAQNIRFLTRVDQLKIKMALSRKLDIAQRTARNMLISHGQFKCIINPHAVRPAIQKLLNFYGVILTNVRTVVGTVIFARELIVMTGSLVVLIVFVFVPFKIGFSRPS